MAYLVTGATGLVGRNLVARLLAERSGPVFVLVRPSGLDALEGLRAGWGPAATERVHAVVGDVEEEGCGLAPADHDRLRRAVDHVFHLAANQDPTDRRSDVQHRTNVDGTRHVMRLAADIGATCFHHVSCWGVAGDVAGTWTEDRHDGWGRSGVPQLLAKREAEELVQDECPLAYRVYRPGIVVGRSDTGETDAVDGLTHLFPALRTIGDLLPRWAALPELHGGLLDIVPADFVAAALDVIAHRPGLDGRTFHLTSGEALPLNDVLNVVADLARAPRFTLHPGADPLALVPEPTRRLWTRLMARPASIAGSFLDLLGVPHELMELATYRTRFDRSAASAALAGSGVACPPFGSYARTLWRYWEDHLDPEPLGPPTLEEAVGDKTVLITGASSGIGEAAARQFAAAGARVLVVARREDRLRALADEIAAAGGEAHVYTADLSRPEEAQGLAARVLADHGGVDLLVNNAGHSINRLLEDSFDRLHDYQRTMAINYFGPVALTLGLLPAMRERGGGHVINVLSAGAQTVGPGFSAYCASKAALDMFGQSVGGELADDGITCTNIYMGLVHTAMSDPTEYFRHIYGLTPEEAGAIVCDAAVHRRPAVSCEPSPAFLRVLNAVWPEGAAAMLRAAVRGYRVDVLHRPER